MLPSRGQNRILSGILLMVLTVLGELADVHIRTDANNLVTTASTTHQPEQKKNHAFKPEATEGKQQRTDARSGTWEKIILPHATAKADEFIKSVMTGVLPNVDVHPPFRTMSQNQAFLVEWLSYNTTLGPTVLTFLAEDISAEV